jgi:hypothetical protein
MSESALTVGAAVEESGSDESGDGTVPGADIVVVVGAVVAVVDVVVVACAVTPQIT